MSTRHIRDRSVGRAGIRLLDYHRVGRLHARKDLANRDIRGAGRGVLSLTRSPVFKAWTDRSVVPQVLPLHPLPGIPRTLHKAIAMLARYNPQPGRVACGHTYWTGPRSPCGLLATTIRGIHKAKQADAQRGE